MNQLPVSALKAFACVHRYGGVRAAARELGIAHSAVSRHVRDLEAWIGSPLIARRVGRRPLVFTPQGERLALDALEALDGLDGAVRSVREMRNANAVVIATTPSIAARWLLPRLADLQQALPWVEVSVVAEQTAASPKTQNADIALRMGRGPWSGLACTPIMDDALYPVARPGYWERLAGIDAPARLAGATLLHDRDPDAAWQAWFAEHPNGNVDLRAGPRFTSSDLVLRAAVQGLGVALARDRLVADDLASGALMRPFGVDEVVIENAYWIVRADDATLRAAEEEVMAWIAGQAAAGG